MNRRGFGSILVRRLGLALAASALASSMAIAGGPEEAPMGQTAEAAPGPFWVYIGTYTTDGDSRGIYRMILDPETGRLTEPELAAVAVNPSFLAVSPDRRFLYAVGEIDNYEGQSSGSVSAFTLDPSSGALELINSQPSEGGAPCHLVVDATGKAVLVANYSGGNVAVLPIGEGGQLSPASDVEQHTGSGADPRRQEGPHAHSINLDAANRFAVAADLGLDKLLVYRFDAGQGTLTPNDPPAASVAPGSGPRHFAFHPDGRHAYVINEMASTVTALAYDPDRGVLELIQTVTTLPEGFDGRNSTAEVQVHPSGRFVYGSNRGQDSIAIFAVDPDSGQLSPVGHQPTGGQTPRNFGIDPTGRYLLAANQRSGTIVAFRIDLDTGRLTPTGQEVRVPVPVCVKFVPKGP